MNSPTIPSINLHRVETIVAVDHAFIPTVPAHLSFKVTGQVSSSGWTEVQLLRREPATEPADGIWEYDLLAKPPVKPVPMSPTTIVATEYWQNIDPTKVKGIRIFGVGQGVKEFLLP